MKSQRHRNSEFYWEGIAASVLGGKSLGIILDSGHESQFGWDELCHHPTQDRQLEIPCFPPFPGLGAGAKGSSST